MAEKRKIKVVNKKSAQVNEVVTETVITEDELILGKKPEIKKELVINYESANIKYKITNLLAKNSPMIVDGSLVETFIGTNNKEVREQLKRGQKVAISKDKNNREMYKIEVID